MLFNYYGGTSIAFWEDRHLAKLNRLVSRMGHTERNYGMTLTTSCDSRSSYNLGMDENYARVREFGRWLTEIEGGGSPAMPIDLTRNDCLISMTYGLPPLNVQGLEGKTEYEYNARRRNRSTYDINDQVVSNRCAGSCQALVKVVFNDFTATTLFVENQQEVLGTVQTTGQGGIKTATFRVNTPFNNTHCGGDFTVRTASSAKTLPVMLTRINFVTR